MEMSSTSAFDSVQDLLLRPPDTPGQQEGPHSAPAHKHTIPSITLWVTRMR